MYATDWKEDVSPDEDARFDALARRLAALKADRDGRYGERARALHRHAHAGALGEFVVREDLASVLPTDLHVGPFRPGARYPAYARFSNGSWDRAKKDVPDIRAVAMKLVGVPGRKLLTGQDTPSTQDFLLNHTPTMTARTPEEFVALAEAVSKGELGALPRLIGSIGFGRAFAVLLGAVSGLNKLPFSSYATSTYYSMAPFRLGPAAACFSLAGAGAAAPSAPGLTADLADRLRAGAAWDFRVQLYQDPARTPIEDSTRAWDSTWIPVARLEIPPTDPDSPRAKAIAAYVERLSFDPWHAVEDLRPLGVFNRARKVAYYQASVKDRDAAPEPDGSETFDVTAGTGT